MSGSRIPLTSTQGVTGVLLGLVETVVTVVWLGPVPVVTPGVDTVGPVPVVKADVETVGPVPVV